MLLGHSVYDNRRGKIFDSESLQFVEEGSGVSMDYRLGCDDGVDRKDSADLYRSTYGRVLEYQLYSNYFSTRGGEVEFPFCLPVHV